MSEPLSPDLDRPTLKLAEADVSFSDEVENISSIEMAEGFDFLLALNRKGTNIFSGIDLDRKSKLRNKGKLAKKARKAQRRAGK